MEENNENKSEFSVDIDKEELKNQTKETVNQTKETIKNINFKKDASATKVFLLEMISKPFSTIEKVVSEKENCFSNAVIFIICWMVLNALELVIFPSMFKSYYTFSLKALILSVVSPILYILAFSVATIVFGGKEKKNITTIISGLTIASVPKILATVCGIVHTIVSINIIGYLDTILSNTLSFIAMALTFVAIKGLITKEDDEDKAFRKVSVIVLVGYTIIKILSICGIY